MILVAVVVVVVVELDVVVVVVEPERDGVSMWPANAGKASVKLRIATALIRRKVFTLGAS